MKEKKEVKIGYSFREESQIHSCRNSEGSYMYIETDTYCYGLHTNVESLNINLQDYELLFDIEKKYRPKDHVRDDSGPIYYMTESEEDSSTSYIRIDMRLVQELNQTLSKRLGVTFVGADTNEILPYHIYKSNNCEIFEELEEEREKELNSIYSEILKLQRRIEWLENKSNQKVRCGAAVSGHIMKLAEQGRINVNEKIPHLDLFPLQIAEHNHSVDMYELLIRHGADGFFGEHPLQFHSWLGFFKMFQNFDYMDENDLFLIINALYELSDTELETLFIDETPQLNYKGFVVKERYILDFRRFFLDYYEGIKLSDTMTSLLEALISDRRYRAIEILSEFSHSEPQSLGLDYMINPLIFLNDAIFELCVQNKDLEALKALEDVLGDSYYDENSEFAKKYCTEDNLGNELMNYLRLHNKRK